jgi:fibronectin type 3 domain-containing protein
MVWPARQAAGPGGYQVSYRVYYGTSPTNLANSKLLSGVNASSTTITGLAQNTYYFAVTTLNSAGAESSRSDVVSRTLP